MHPQEWCPAPQRRHTWLTTYGGPQTSQLQGQLWDSAVLEQWSTAITIPSLRAAHMRVVGPHHIGTEFTRQILPESQKVWLTHAKAPEGLIKARARPAGTMVWALRELQLHQQVEQQGVRKTTLN